MICVHNSGAFFMLCEDVCEKMSELVGCIGQNRDIIALIVLFYHSVREPPYCDCECPFFF